MQMVSTSKKAHQTDT